jgi:hypothetical protein
MFWNNKEPRRKQRGIFKIVVWLISQTTFFNRPKGRGIKPQGNKRNAGYYKLPSLSYFLCK